MCTKTFTTVTFGCKVNQYESQAISESIIRGGYEWREPADGLDAYVINTCTVTEVAYKEAFNYVAKLANRNHGAKIVVTGCAANSNESEFRRIAGVTLERIKGRVPSHITNSHTNQGLQITSFNGHTRAFLKVQDGCDLNCSFCIIPTVRGPNRSRDIEEIVKEAGDLTNNGYREIVITGVHLGSYGKDIARKSLLSSLVSKLLQNKRLERVRLSSIEINEIYDDLIDIMVADERFCPHLHLPLQSGDNSVLKAMRRRYNSSQFLRRIENIRNRIDKPSFSTDVIVGFPTETDEQFENTLKFCERVQFSRTHIFTYSHRSGTDASRLKDLPRQVKKQRYERLRQLSSRLAADYYRKFEGKSVSVLVESTNGQSTGYTERYLKATIPGTHEKGAVIRAVVARTENDGLICNAVCKNN